MELGIAVFATDRSWRIDEVAAVARPHAHLSPSWAWPKPERLAQMRAAGVDRVTLWLPSVERAQALPVLDQYAALLPVAA